MEVEPDRQRPNQMTTKSNIVSLKSISPPRYEGEVTEWQLEQIVRGLLNPDDSFVRRLAYDRLREYGKKVRG